MHYIKPTAKGLIFMCLIFVFIYKSYSQTSICVDYNEKLSTSNYTTQIYLRDKADFNGDGLGDFIVLRSYGVHDVYFGTEDFQNITVNQTLFYTQIITPGDINKDHFDDVVAITKDSLLVYYGTINGLQLQSQLTITTTNNYITLSGGDFNKDGFADFMVNTKKDIDPQNGNVLIYHGSENGPILHRSISGNELNTELFAVRFAGDLNNDGYPEIMVPKGFDQLIFYGTNEGFDPNKKTAISIFSLATSSNLDINGDGIEDLLIMKDQLNIESPSVFIFLGNLNGISTSPQYQYTNPRYNLEDGENYGFNGGPLGDINKDGFEDFYVSGGTDNYTEIFFGNSNVSSIKPKYRINQETFSIISLDIKNDNDADLLGTFKDDNSNEIFIGLIESINNEFPGSVCPIAQIPVRTYYGDNAMAAGDMNKDGFDDFVVTYIYEDPFMATDGSGYVVLGSKNAPGAPVVQLDNYFLMGEQMSSGDLNGDGYSDIYFGSEGYDTQNKYSAGIIFSHFGKENPLDNEIDFQDIGATDNTYLGNMVARNGDINGDGFDDILTQSVEGILIYYGKAEGPDTIPSWKNSEYGGIYGVGDLNHDGYSDFFAVKGGKNTLFYGSANGPVISDYSVNYAINYIGDINNDGFDDAQLKEFTFPFKPIKVLLGSANGYIDSNLPSNKLYTPAGDYNGDGIDDVMASVKFQDGLFERSRVEIYLGSDNGIKDSSDFTFHPAGKSEGIYPVASLGDINNDGKGDIALRQGQYNIQIYYGRSVENDSCQNDKTLPLIVSPTTQVKCSGAGIVNIPELIATDNCSIKSINYVITGATSRSGTGTNATGQFNKGISTITWTVTDLAGNTATAIQHVKVEQELHASIPKAYQINATQSAPYTIYLGYANNTIRLVAWESRTKGPYRYKWSNGDTARYTRVKHNTPGKYNHWVIISNDFGCSDTAYTTITVVDNYCPNPLKDFISQYFPQYLNDPFVQSLLMATSQSYVCINGNTQCVPTGSLKNYINSGAKLGKCGSIPNAANLKTTEEITLAEVLNITASPNPSSYEFNLKISGTKGKPYSLRLYNNTGALVMQKHNLTQDFIRTGSTLQKGIYVAEVIQGNQRKSIRLLKIK